MERSLSGTKPSALVRLERERIGQGTLVLVNAGQPARLPAGEARLEAVSGQAGLMALDPSIRLERECLARLQELLAAAGAKDGIVVVSGYRSREEQRAIYESSLRDNGPDYTAQYVALPGRSEHHTGLAVDVGELNDGVLDFIAPSFPDRGSCLAFKRLAARYGFVQRYKEGKEAVTGIACEPWHYRYVGRPHAEQMVTLGYCLEEYTQYIKSFVYEGPRLTAKDEQGTYEMYYVRASDGPWTDVPLPDCDTYAVSGNNVDGFIITAYRAD